MNKLVLPENLQGHLNYPEREIVWKQDEVVALINEMIKQDYAPSSWQVQYQFPDATCDLYWVYFQNPQWDTKQDWKKYVAECYDNFLAAFNDWTENKDIKKEVMDFRNVKAYTEEQKNT